MIEFVLIAGLWVNPVMVKTLEETTTKDGFSSRVSACRVDMGYGDSFFVKRTQCKDVIKILNGERN